MKKLNFLIIFLISIGLFNTIETKELEVAWETEAKFELPESVIFDSKNEVLYVSSIANHPFKKDGSGYISKVGLDGEILELKWLESLNAPKGLTIVNDKLYIADVDELVEVEISTKTVTKYKGAGAVCFNDVTHDKYGNVYVADTYTDSIYRLNQFNQLPLWFYSPNLSPNGLHMDDEDGNLIVGSWGSLMEGWGTPEKSGNLVQINIHSKKMKNLGKRKPIGNLDGVESDGSDGYYVTDWSTGRLYQIWKNGKFDVLKTLAKGAADLEVLIEKKLIIVPVMTEGKVVALKID
jgi:sugar lactone lactonase YvrE